MKILVVDDNTNDRTLISKMLMEHGNEALEANNGFEAQELLKSIVPDLIISNIDMPGLDGFTLLLRLKKKPRTNMIPFVFYTGTYVSDEDRELGLSLGASRYILKSSEPKEFLCEIKKVLKEFKEGELKPRKPIITEEEYLKKYSDRISHKLESEIDKIDREIEKHLLGIINDMLDLVKVESGENLPLDIEYFNANEGIDETRKVGEMAQFLVSDTGIGIKEEEIGKPFSLFYQADSEISRKYGGTGVGLAIIKQLVEQHGGRLWVESKYGEGSTFSFTIPLIKNTEENK